MLYLFNVILCFRLESFTVKIHLNLSWPWSSGVHLSLFSTLHSLDLFLEDLPKDPLTNRCVRKIPANYAKLY